MPTIMNIMAVVYSIALTTVLHLNWWQYILCLLACELIFIFIIPIVGGLIAVFVGFVLNIIGLIFNKIFNLDDVILENSLEYEQFHQIYDEAADNLSKTCIYSFYAILIYIGLFYILHWIVFAKILFFIGLAFTIFEVIVSIGVLFYFLPRNIWEYLHNPEEREVGSGWGLLSLFINLIKVFIEVMEVLIIFLFCF